MEEPNRTLQHGLSPSLKCPWAMIGMTNIPSPQAQQMNITPTQSKYKNLLCSHMWPDPSIKTIQHTKPSWNMQQQDAQWTVDPPWTCEHLEAAVNRGPHLSAKTPNAANCL